MAVKTLQLSLGSLEASQYQAGWYQDPISGQYYYYDTLTRQWYIYSAGYLHPLSVPKETAPKVVDIAPGDTLRIEYSYKYQGPAISVTEYASVGKTIAGIYDEKVHQSRNRDLPRSDILTTHSGNLDLVLPATAATDWSDIEAKVFDGGKELGVNYQNALNVIGVTPEFTEFAIVDYSKV